MPTVLPRRSRAVEAAQRLSWPDTARFVILLLQVRWLNRRFGVTHRRVERYDLDAPGPALLATARRWVAAHEAINAHLGTAELPEVVQVRTMMRRPIEVAGGTHTRPSE